GHVTARHSAQQISQQQLAQVGLVAGAVHARPEAGVAVEAVRGHGGAPAALPLTLLWYVPVRAELRARGEQDIPLADFTASIPLAFLRTTATEVGRTGERGIVAWWRAVVGLPAGSRVRAERASRCGALALWWSGCFPQHVERRGGRGMIRAYLDFGATMLSETARLVEGYSVTLSALYRRAAERIELMRDSLQAASADYLGPDAHTTEGRLERYLRRLAN
ncbi:MAG: hypothetical protein JSW43_05580, partial [Gemmatimonadota bacterium]